MKIVGDKNYLLRIDELYAFVTKDEDGNEGIAGFLSPDGWMPLIGADMNRVHSLMSMAKEIAKNTNIEMTLCVFSCRADKETIKP